MAIRQRNYCPQHSFDRSTALAGCFRSMPAKVEYLPLFPAGFVPMTMDELRRVCVKGFPLSRTRRGIMDGLEEIVFDLENAEVTGSLWVDGSFVTHKIDPEDVDILLCVNAVTYDNGSPALKAAIDRVEQHQIKTSHHCDSYVLREYPAGHALANEADWDRAYWNKQFGFSRDDQYKGIVRLAVQGISERAKAGDPYAQLVLLARLTI